MEKKRKWSPKKLRPLHTWNAWIFYALALSGILLYFPQIRGVIAGFRVTLKHWHIYLGLASILLLLMYSPFFIRHIKRIWRKAGQRYNLLLILIVIIGLSGSGVVLWQFRNLPPVWSSIALVVHDIFSYIGIPYALYHSVSRSQWVKKAFEIKKDPETEKVRPSFARRRFIRISAGSILALIAGPLLYKWLSGVINVGAGAKGGNGSKPKFKTDDNHMLPHPEPSKGTFPLEKGGGDGVFRPYTVTRYPSFTSDKWEFKVSGLVDKPMTFDWKGFLELPRKVEVRDFHCVTGWSVYHVTWEGVLLSDLLKMAGVKGQAKYVKFYSGDGVYTDSLTIEQAHMDDVLVAVLRDGNPIPQDYGGPTRLVVPKMYGYKSVKWLNGIELIDHSMTGFWEKRGYKKNAWVDGKNGGFMF
ncbi:MAG TPA: molybdopterin-dependent oxidoreductase [Bacillales bacterium]|nr:molybdopterin-dependent oxidoreductase [Bacillales bacterium]